VRARNFAAPPPRPARTSSEKKMPEVMAKLFVHFRSAAIRQNSQAHPRPTPRRQNDKPVRSARVCFFCRFRPAWKLFAETNPYHHLDVITILTAFAIRVLHSVLTSQLQCKKFQDCAIRKPASSAGFHLEGIRRLGYVELLLPSVNRKIDKAKTSSPPVGLVVERNRGGLSPHPGRSGRRCRT